MHHKICNMQYIMYLKHYTCWDLIFACIHVEFNNQWRGIRTRNLIKCSINRSTMYKIWNMWDADFSPVYDINTRIHILIYPLLSPPLSTITRSVTLFEESNKSLYTSLSNVLGTCIRTTSLSLVSFFLSD